jgi:hypothetical protein
MQNILKAAREEMLRALEGELTALNFAKAIRIAKMAERIASAEGRSYLGQVQKQVLEETEFYCPPLHRAILDEIMAGDTVAREKYDRLHRTHTEAEQVRQAVEIARDKVGMTHAQLQAKEEALQKEREMLHRERELLRRLQDTLMLTAGDQEVDIPQLPELLPLEEEEEAAEED